MNILGGLNSTDVCQHHTSNEIKLHTSHKSRDEASNETPEETSNKAHKLWVYVWDKRDGQSICTTSCKQKVILCVLAGGVDGGRLKLGAR